MYHSFFFKIISLQELGGIIWVDTLLKIKHTTLIYTNLDCFQKKI